MPYDPLEFIGEIDALAALLEGAHRILAVEGAAKQRQAIRFMQCGYSTSRSSR